MKRNATTDELYACVGRTIRQLRKSRGVSQTKLARAVNCAPHHMSWIESGKRRPSPSLFSAIVTMLEKELHLDEGETVSLCSAILHESLSGTVELKQTGVDGFEKYVLSLPTGKRIGAQTVTHSSKEYRKDVRRIVDVLTGDSALRQACDFFVGTAARRRLLVHAAQQSGHRRILDLLSSFRRDQLTPMAEALKVLQKFDAEQIKTVSRILKVLVKKGIG